MHSIEFVKGDVYLRDMKNTRYVSESALTPLRPLVLMGLVGTRQRSIVVHSTRRTKMSS